MINNNLFPITFSIPHEKIVESIPKKTKLLAKINPYGVGASTYIFTNETDYYNDYKESLFAFTRKKGGWDCMRHYEILACGCIPIFEKLEECPQETMFNFPKNIILDANVFFQKISNKYNVNCDTTISVLDEDDIAKCYNFINTLLQYTRDNLTTISLAKYILNHTIPDAKRVLYISDPANHEDYLMCLTLHGFKELFKKNCNDYPFWGYIYNYCDENSHINYKDLHGKGFSYTNLIDKSEYHDFDEENNTINNIKDKKYDLIIYSGLHKHKPFFDIVNENYDKDKIVLLCGEDLHKCIYNEYCNKGYKVFVREL